MAMSELHQRIHAALLCIQLNGPKDQYLGICANVVGLINGDSSIDDAVDDALGDLFNTWPHKSHSPGYPVGNWSDNPYRLFWSYFDHRRSMWSDDQYGKARHKLLAHCIKELS